MLQVYNTVVVTMAQGTELQVSTGVLHFADASFEFITLAANNDELYLRIKTDKSELLIASYHVFSVVGVND